ncbi:hypothetical protein [Rhodococcus opacus]|uniref:Hypothetical membrane protein n=1 Tax=Rhodococcus opacus (strain B4) TaxID=632772 RepID=C1B846_RHOOB|nr:hypothetical protein [Rhodococcus opacus]BAH51849.1 hypothetical membrane protein [Rhodococcus opacus B4]
MTVGMAVILTIPIALILLVAVFTGIGEHRRTNNLGLSLLAVPCFPVFWIAWYVRDDFGRATRTHHAQFAQDR